jgi:hypothetical protein
MIMRTLAAFALALPLACATSHSNPDLPAPPASAPIALGPTASGAVAPGGKSSFNPKVWVSWQDAAADCEASARAMRDSSPDDGWQALRACVELGRFNRGPFALLNLLTAYWDEELRTRPEAVRLVGRVIANRGGDVDGDISRLQAVRMPVFTLKAALAQPSVYKGRYIIIRGKLTDVKTDAKSATAMLAEMSMKPADLLRIGQDAQFIKTRTNVYKVFGEHRFSENVMNPTGRVALGKLPEADPFLEPDKEFVFVGRFDGARPTSDSDNKLALLNVIAYYRPAALVVQ